MGEVGRKGPTDECCSMLQRRCPDQKLFLGRWAQLDAGHDEPEQDSQVHKMAMNVGRRPSIEDGTNMTVEVHILHAFQSANFRGKHLRVVGTGYIRSVTPFQAWEATPSGCTRSTAGPACKQCLLFVELVELCITGPHYGPSHAGRCQHVCLAQ